MSDNKKIVILLNDSDPLMARVCKNKFEKEKGWQSLITANYDEALKEIKEQEPDIVLTEILLKGSDKDGFDLIKEIRTEIKLNDTKIFVFTELNQESDREKATKLGAQEYFIKSQMTIKEVIDQIEKLA